MEPVALVMCGGRGSRLGYVEKPMLEIGGKRLIDMAIDEIESAMVESIFVTSRYTPETEKYLKRQGFEVFRGGGRGYMEDLREVLNEYQIIFPVLNINSDLYYVSEGVIREFVEFYFSSKFPAVSAVFEDGEYAGINAFDPIFEWQEEEKIILSSNKVINIDTPEDLERAKWKSSLKKEREWLKP